MTVGQFVITTAGKDKDRVYIVKDIIGNNLFLVDGKYRLWSNPKKKSCKHCDALQCVIDFRDCCGSDYDAFIVHQLKINQSKRGMNV